MLEPEPQQSKQFPIIRCKKKLRLLLSKPRLLYYFSEICFAAFVFMVEIDLSEIDNRNIPSATHGNRRHHVDLNVQ